MVIICTACSNPMLQSEIAKGIIPIDQHERRIDQKTQGNGDHQDLENDHGDQHDTFHFSQLAQLRHETAPANGLITPAGTDQPLVEHDSDNRKHDQHNRQDKGVRLITDPQTTAQHGCKYIVLDRRAQDIWPAKSAHYFGKGHDDTRKHRRHDQREGDLAQDAQRLAPIRSPASSRLESTDIRAAETNRKKKV